MPAWPVWMPDPLTTLVLALTVSCAALAALNVWQYAKYHGTVSALKGTLDHIFEHGHSVPGTVLVPEHAVAVAPEKLETTTETLTAMAGGTLPKGWHLDPDSSSKLPWNKP